MKYITCLVLSFTFLLTSCENAKEYHTDAKKYIKENKYELALNSINSAIQLEPDSVDHYTIRMIIFDITGRYEEEILDLNKIIDLNTKQNSKSINAHQQRAIAQLRSGLYNEALSDINYFIENRDTIGSLAEAYIIKGSCLWKLGDSKNSKIYYELALKENNSNKNLIESEALVGLANLIESPQAAIELLNKAISINDKSGLAYGARMERYMSLGKVTQAYEDSKRALILNPDDATIYFNMGQLFSNYLSNSDSAVKYFEKAIKLSPQSTSNGLIYMNLAVINHQSSKLESALANFQKAESFDSKNDLLLYNYALLLADLNKNTEALEKISNAIDINSSDAEYFNLRGSILLSLSLLENAEKEFKKALEINPKYGTAFYNLGYLFGEQNNHEESIKYYGKAILLNYDLKATLVNRALEKIKIDNTLGACADLELAYKLGRMDIKSLIEKNCR